MRALHTDLLAAQKTASAIPYLKVTLSDRIGGIRRLAWTRVYTGGEPDGHHAAAMPGDGSLVRARVSGGRLYYQRVVSPGAGSDFATWTDVGAAANSGVALCADGSRLMLFYLDVDGVTLKLRESMDSGATLGAPATVATAVGTAAWLAADVKSNGDALIIYSVAASVYRIKRSAGAWGAPAAWSNSAASVTGLACHYQGDFNIAVTGTDSAGHSLLWTCIYGDGFSQAPNSWSALREVTRASAGSSVSLRSPFLAEPDTYRLSVVEKYIGGQSYSRPYYSYSPVSADFAFNLWREPVPFNLSSEYGLAIVHGGGAAVWLSAPFGVWSADVATTDLEVTADVIEAKAWERPLEGRLTLALRNDDGRYSAPPAQLKLGAQVAVSPGYVTQSGGIASAGPAYWIDSIERMSSPGGATVVVGARDAWGLLNAWRARRQYAWAAGERNFFAILQWLFARAGLDFSSLGNSPQVNNSYPAFTINPGDTALTAVRRLLSALPDVIFARGPFCFLTEPLASDPASYAFGGDHPLLSGRYAEMTVASRAQAFGAPGVFAERFDWAGVERSYDSLEQAHDANLSTVALADERAGASLRKQAIKGIQGEIRAPVNCGQELYDVIEVTDPRAGISGALYRVLGLDLRYSVAGPVYEHRLLLGGV